MNTTAAKQLELNFGMLTAAQQERVDRYKKNQERSVVLDSAEESKIEKLLLEAGFRPGHDFINTTEVKSVTAIKSFGYGENEFETEITYNVKEGGCKLITDRYDRQKNEMVVGKVYLTLHYDKLECSTITGNYRAYKPTSLFNKLQDYNTDQKNKYAHANKTKTILNYTIEKYKKLFPNATVEEGMDYRKRGRGHDYIDFPIVYVKFESGSWLSFRLGHEIDREYTHKKFNRVTSEMTSMAVLEMFNNQEAIK